MLKSLAVLLGAAVLLSACATEPALPYPAFDGFGAHGGMEGDQAMDAYCSPQLAVKGHC